MKISIGRQKPEVKTISCPLVLGTDLRRFRAILIPVQRLTDCFQICDKLVSLNRSSLSL